MAGTQSVPLGQAGKMQTLGFQGSPVTPSGHHSTFQRKSGMFSSDMQFSYCITEFKERRGGMLGTYWRGEER